MLVGFRFKNYASYKEETDLSMMASSKKEFKEFNTFESKEGRLLKSVLMYGANGSGKSNIIKALKFMKAMVEGSVMKKNLIKLNEPFKFNVESINDNTLFEITFLVEDILYTYGFEIFKDKVEREWLDKKIQRTSRLFERTSPNGDSIELHGAMKEAENIKKRTREDALFITVANAFNIEPVKEIIEWFSRLNIITSDFSTPGYTVEYLEENSESKDIILKYLKEADLVIDDFDWDIKEMELDEDFSDFLLNEVLVDAGSSDKSKFSVKGRKVEIQTLHNVYDDDGNIAKKITLPFKYQSQGTIKFFELLGPILEALKKGEILVIDEIDSKLHCALVRFTLTLFNSIDKNPSNAQLICNTHDVLLLEEDIRRDQIWFVQKNKFGESELYSLDDFNGVKKNDLKLKKYLLGVYGAIPKISESEIDG